jgi:hypothetical protein
MDVDQAPVLNLGAVMGALTVLRDQAAAAAQQQQPQAMDIANAEEIQQLREEIVALRAQIERM